MSKANIFIPEAERNRTEQPAVRQVSRFNIISNFFVRVSQWLLVAIVGLFPLVSLPDSLVPRSFEITTFVIIGLSLLAIMVGISSLSKPSVQTQAPFALCAFAGFVFLSFLSVFSHGGSFEVLWGRTIEPLTFAFALLLLAASIAPLLLQGATKMLVRALSLVAIVMVVIMFHTVLRFWFGLSIDFGVLNNVTESLIGGFNDTAIYAGLVICGVLVSSLMLPLRQFAQIILSFVCILALAVLVVVNFKLLWIILAFVSGVTMLYVGLRQFVFETEKSLILKISTIALPVLVFLVTGFYALFGSVVAGHVAAVTNIEFFEVRPSLEATIGIGQGVYENNLLFGVGPQQFDNAWRTFKDPTINETVFWDTDFNNGYSFVTSVFITHGLLAGLALVLFHVLFVVFGIRRLNQKVAENVFARFVMTLSFVSAVYLWITTYFYMSGTTILLLAAFFTGLTYAANSLFQDQKTTTIPLAANRVASLLMVAGVAVVVVVAIYTITTSLDRVHTLNSPVEEALDSNDPLEYARLTQFESNNLNTLIRGASPETLSQDDLLAQAQSVLAAARKAVELDPANPLHYVQLATLYTTLGRIGVDGGFASASDTLKQVLVVDSKNPKHYLALAQLALLQDQQAAAKEYLQEAVSLKSNYTQALQLQAEIAIASGEVETAIGQLESIIQLNQTNPARWYQLGVLYSANSQSDKAIAAYARSIELDPQYADARFSLGLEYLAINENDLALEQLQAIRITNPDNEVLLNIIERIENSDSDDTVDISDVSSVEEFVESSSGADFDSDLVAPINTTDTDRE